MKSKSVASILRHVASKMPSLDSSDPTSPTEPTTAEIAAKKNRRAAAKLNPDDPSVLLDDSLRQTGPVGGVGEEEKLEMLYDTIGWPLGKTYGHPYDAFKLALTCVVLSLTFQ